MCIEKGPEARGTCCNKRNSDFGLGKILPCVSGAAEKQEPKEDDGYPCLEHVQA